MTYALILSTVYTKTETSTSYDFIDVIKVFIPIILFLAGLYTNRILERIKENKRLRDVEIYLFSIIDNLNTSINTQNDLFIKASRSLKKYKKSRIFIEYTPMFSTENIKIINYTDLYKVFVSRRQGDTKSNSDAFIVIQSTLNTVDLIKLEIEQQKQRMYSLNIELRENWNKSIRKIAYEHSQLKAIINENNSDPYEDPTVITIQELLKVIANKVDDLGFIEVDRIFIKPALLFFETRPIKPTYIPISTAFSELRSANNKIITFKEYNIELLIRKARLLNHTSIKLQNAISLLKSRKLNNKIF